MIPLPPFVVRYLRKLVLALLLVVLSCRTLVVGTDGFIRLDPPPSVYATWLEELKTCTSLNGNISEIEWFVLSGGEFAVDGRRVAGLRWPPNLIVLAAQWLFSEGVVKHEMLHYLLDGDADHGSPLWVQCIPEGYRGQ